MAQSTLCAARDAALFPKLRAVSKKIFPFHLIAKKTEATGSKRNHLYHLCMSTLKIRTRWFGYWARVCLMSSMMVFEVGSVSFHFLPLCQWASMNDAQRIDAPLQLGAIDNRASRDGVLFVDGVERADEDLERKFRLSEWPDKGSEL